MSASFFMGVDSPGRPCLEWSNHRIRRHDMAEEKKSPRKSAAGTLVAAGLILGMGIGWAFGYLVPGLFIGLGVGLLAYAIIMLTAKD